MRAVIDTNVLVSGLLWYGTPHTLMERVRDNEVILLSSPALLAELARVIRRPKFLQVLAAADTEAEHMLADVARLALMIEPPALAERISRDPDDDAVLALAIAGRADVIVSGDNDLLALGSHAGISIIDAAAALLRVTASRGTR